MHGTTDPSPPAAAGRSPRRSARPSAAGLVYGLCVATSTVLVVLPWFQTRLLPLMDYPMFLSFVRTWVDLGDPGSPLSRHFSLGWPLSPLILPLGLTGALARISDVETAGRALHVVYAAGMVAASAWLLHVLGKSRWNLVLLFPLIFGKWLSSGFVGFVTGMPLVLLTLGLAVRSLSRPGLGYPLGLSVVLAATVLWHGLIGPLALLSVAVVQLCWRAPSFAARARAAIPLVPAVALLVLWAARLASATPAGAEVPVRGLEWAPLAERLDPGPFFDRVLMLFPGSRAWALALLAPVVVLGLTAGRTPSYEPGLPALSWRVENPAAPLVLMALALYLLLPANALGVEIVNARFAWVAMIFLVFAWRLPGEGPGGPLAVAAVALVGLAYLTEINLRFRQFHRETAGASRLIDAVGPGEGLIAPMRDAETAAFRNVPLREVQQYATIRKHSLPTTSFAGYGVNPVRYRAGLPVPRLTAANWRDHPGLNRFDWVLLRRPTQAEQRHPMLRLFRQDGDFFLFEICGSARRPSC